MVDYIYDRRTNRYRNTATGRYMSKAQIISQVEASISAAGDVTDQMAVWVTGNDGQEEPMLTPEDWRDMLKGHVKREEIRQAILGRGGAGEMTAADWGAVGNLLANNTDGGEYARIDAFYQDLLMRQANETLTAAWLAARSRLYFGAARQSYERMNTRAHGLTDLPSYPGDKNQTCHGGCKCEWQHEKIRDADGNLVEIHSKWVLEPTAEHCEPTATTRGCVQNAQEYNPLVTAI